MKDNIVLMSTVGSIFADDKGILAADESTETIAKRFAKVGIENTEENRQAYRELLFTTQGVEEFISGVIMFDETFRQAAEDGRTLPDVLKAVGILPGIKVDQGTDAMPASALEKITKGLDGLPARLAEYAKLGAKFAKWRAVITIADGLPTDGNIRKNARDLAAYARFCQDADIVPVIEPEVLMDGAHDMARCAEVTEKTLRTVFEEVHTADVSLTGLILKTGMVLPGSLSAEKRTPEEIAVATVEVFKKAIPAGLPGIVFLSGGQTEVQASENLEAFGEMVDLPWKISFSYGRALQESAIAAWQGKIENVAAAQSAFYKRAQMNSFAIGGIYSSEIETA